MYDVIIIGGGPAGLTAGIYCGRFKLKAKILEKGNFGGLVNLTDSIENYPGAYKVKSKELVEAMLNQCRGLDSVELKDYQEVVSVKSGGGSFEVCSNSLMDGGQTKDRCSAVIIAVGSMPKRLGILGEEKFIGKGVSYCAICDAPFFKGKDIAVIGGGDTALEEALYLAKFASKVYIVHRRDQLRASAILEERARSSVNIEFVLSSVCEEISGLNKVEKVSVKNISTGRQSEIPCSGVFIFVGYTPNTDFLKGSIDLAQDGWVMVDNKMMTNIDGIFACGDCIDKSLRQIVTACGDAATSSFHCFNFIQKRKEREK